MTVTLGDLGNTGSLGDPETRAGGGGELVASATAGQKDPAYLGVSGSCSWSASGLSAGFSRVH